MKTRMKRLLGMLLLCMLCVSAITVSSFAAEDKTYRSEKYDVTDKSFSIRGYLEEKESASYTFTLDSKSNVVIFSRFIERDEYPHDSTGIFKLQIKNSKGKVVYTSPRTETNYDVYRIPAGAFQWNTTLPKGTYKMTLTESNPYDWSEIFFEYAITVKWAKTTEILEELVVPKAPTLKEASVDPSTGHVNLSWTEAAGANGYCVVRSDKPGYADCLTRWENFGKEGNWMCAHDEITETSFVDKTAKKGMTYDYYVVAVNTKNFECCDFRGGTWSNHITVTFKLPTPEIKATNAANSGKVKLSWDKVKRANSYKVYRATSKNGEYSLQKTVTTNYYTDTSAKPGKTYFYKVKAIKKNNSAANSYYSKKISAVCRLAKPVVKTSNVAKTGKIKLTWKAVDGADKYVVYRSTSKSGEYKQLYTTSKTSFINTGAEAEKLYFYKVKAIDTNKDSASSAYSAISSKRCDLKRPVVKVSKSTKAKLTWTKVEGATEYKIYRATSKNGKYTALKTVTGTKYTDKTAKKNKTYYYKVKAISGKSSTANSAYSKVVYVQVK